MIPESRSTSSPSSYEPATNRCQAIMEKLNRSLAYFVEAIAPQAPTISIDMPVRQYGWLRQLIQGNYELSEETKGAISRIALDFTLSNQQKVSLQHLQPNEVNLGFLNDLRDDGLKLAGSRVVGLQTDSQRVQFEVIGNVPGRIVFDGNIDTGEIRIAVLNFNVLGVTEYQLHSNQVDDLFLQQLNDFLLRRNEDMLIGLHPEHSGSWRYKIRTDLFEIVQPEDIQQNTGADILDFDAQRFTHVSQVLLRHRDHEILLNYSGAVCRIGRKFPADIIISSRLVSRDHALLEYQGRFWVFTDHSSNGSFIRQHGCSAVLVHNRSRRLENKGVISLGEILEDGDPDLIYYEIK